MNLPFTLNYYYGACNDITINKSGIGPYLLRKNRLKKRIDSLVFWVKSQYDLDPFSKSIFIFCSRRSNRFKVLYWDGEVGYSTRGMKIENYPAKRC